MVTQIIWTPKADKTFDRITTYLQKKASLPICEKFVEAVYHKIDVIIEHPEIGRPTLVSDSIRFINVDKHHQIFYRFDGSILLLLAFFDTRQDPKKRPF
jgi:plasmid stabilization system protein ParE